MNRKQLRKLWKQSTIIVNGLKFKKHPFNSKYRVYKVDKDSHIMIDFDNDHYSFNYWISPDISFGVELVNYKNRSYRYDDLDKIDEQLKETIQDWIKIFPNAEKTINRQIAIFEKLKQKQEINKTNLLNILEDEI